MEWLEFKPWSSEVARKVEAIHAAEAGRAQRQPSGQQLDGWQGRLKSWPTRDPWGHCDADA